MTGFAWARSEEEWNADVGDC